MICLLNVPVKHPRLPDDANNRVKHIGKDVEAMELGKVKVEVKRVMDANGDAEH